MSKWFNKDWMDLLSFEHQERYVMSETKLVEACGRELNAARFLPEDLNKVASYACLHIGLAAPNARLKAWPDDDWSRLYLNKTDTKRWGTPAWFFIRTRDDGCLSLKIQIAPSTSTQDRKWAYSVGVALGQLVMASKSDK